MTPEQLDLILFAHMDAFELSWWPISKVFVAACSTGLEEPAHICGYGPTPSEAVADLMRKVKGE